MAGLIISKLDAARRQLQTAIDLWFNDGDPVSVHALSFAAYEIAHAVSKKRNPLRPGLLFDAEFIKEERRREFNDLMRKEANFFKHADRDPNAVVEFHPELSEMFMLFAIFALQLCGERESEEESIFVHWISLHRPHLLTEEGGKRLIDRIPVQSVKQIRTLPKPEFFQGLKHARALIRART